MFNNLFNKPCCQNQGTCEVVYEQPINNCVQKDYVHEIKHIVPINTKIINNHIYKNTYIPEYTYEEENTCTSLFDNCPNKF